MANGNDNGSSNGSRNGNQWIGRWVFGGGGVLAVVLGFNINTAKDAQIAIDVAAQHGEEILIMNREIHTMQQELFDRTKDRYTSKDAERDIGYLRRDLDACMAWRSEHERKHDK